MATPHVAGIVGLMAQKSPTLAAAQAEGHPRAHGYPAPGGMQDGDAAGRHQPQVCWGADATGAGLATADAALARTP